jgi:hypothetical protein
VSVIVWEAAGMAPENFSAVFFNESGFWDLASEVSPCISPLEPCNEADGWWGEWRTAFDEQLGDPVQDPASLGAPSLPREPRQVRAAHPVPTCRPQRPRMILALAVLPSTRACVSGRLQRRKADPT